MTLTARYNNGPVVEVLRWHSPSNDPMFHDSAVNETVTLPLQNPVGATSVTLEFRIFDATNNWWWAIDNISVYTGGAPASDGVLRAVIDRGTSNVKIVNNTGDRDQPPRLLDAVGGRCIQRAECHVSGRQRSQLGAVDRPECDGRPERGPHEQFQPGQRRHDQFGEQRLAEILSGLVGRSFQYFVAGNDDPIPAIVEFTGNGGASYRVPRLEFQWSDRDRRLGHVSRRFSRQLWPGCRSIQRYQLGDLDNDSLHTPNDFLRFRSEYNAALGAGAFEAHGRQQVPEPATGVLLLSAVASRVRSLAASAARTLGANLARGSSVACCWPCRQRPPRPS